MRRFVGRLGARWRSFVREADEVRDASSAIAATIRERRRPDDRALSVLPKLSRPADGRISGHFAMRDGRLHEGIDIAAPEGTPVLAALAGVVLLASELSGYGRVVVLDHGADLATVYAHLACLDVAEGARVEAGGRLGAVGTSGRAFGAHLHFEVRLDGTAVDPLVFVS